MDLIHLAPNVEVQCIAPATNNVSVLVVGRLAGLPAGTGNETPKNGGRYQGRDLFNYFSSRKCSTNMASMPEA